MNNSEIYSIYLEGVQDFILKRIYDAVPMIKTALAPYMHLLNFDAVYQYLSNSLTMYNYQGERLLPPAMVVVQGGGDCDNWTVLLCSIAKAFGLPCSMGFLYTPDGQAYHVFPVVDGEVFDPFIPLNFSVPEEALLITV